METILDWVILLVLLAAILALVLFMNRQPSHDREVAKPEEPREQFSSSDIWVDSKGVQRRTWQAKGSPSKMSKESQLWYEKRERERQRQLQLRQIRKARGLKQGEIYPFVLKKIKNNESLLPGDGMAAATDLFCKFNIEPRHSDVYAGLTEAFDRAVAGGHISREDAELLWDACTTDMDPQPFEDF